MDNRKALLRGYHNKEAGPALAAGVASDVASGAMKAVPSMVGSTTSAIRDIVGLIRDAGATALPYAAAAPPLGGLLLGYGLSQAQSPTGEDLEEAQKHLEEQALLQFDEDIKRKREARKMLQERVLAKAKQTGRKEREIRV